MLCTGIPTCSSSFSLGFSSPTGNWGGCWWLVSALPSSSQDPRRGTELCIHNVPYISAEWMRATSALSKASRIQAYTKYSSGVSFALLINIPLDKVIPNEIPLASLLTGSISNVLSLKHCHSNTHPCWVQLGLSFAGRTPHSGALCDGLSQFSLWLTTTSFSIY